MALGSRDPKAINWITSSPFWTGDDPCLFLDMAVLVQAQGEQLDNIVFYRVILKGLLVSYLYHTKNDVVIKITIEFVIKAPFTST